MPLRVVVADDESLPRKRLVRLLEEQGCEIVGVYENGEDLLNAVNQGLSVDALFLDVLMPGMTGLEIVVELKGMVPIVLVTAHAAFTLSAFEHAVFDYILKPVTGDRLGKTLARLRKGSPVSALPQDWKPPFVPVPRFPVQAGDGQVFLELRRVSHFELVEDWVWAWTQGERYRTAWANLTDVEEKFPTETFCRIQRHILLRPGTVAGVRPLWGRRVMVRIPGNLELEVSRGMAGKLKEMLGL